MILEFNTRWVGLRFLVGGLLGVAACIGAAAAETTKESATSETASPPMACLADGKGFFRARLQGSIDAELQWVNEGTECTGATRPDGGVRLGFSRAIYADDERLVILFGVAGLKEGQAARNLPVNVTVIRQGTGQFFGTQGDDKCMFDEIRQEPVTGMPRRNRIYRVLGRGFCTQPARALGNDGVVLVTRFDFAGRVDYAEADTTGDQPAQPASADVKP